jgi:hypothetical protein
MSMTIVPCLFIGRIRSALTVAQRRILLQAWQFRRFGEDLDPRAASVARDRGWGKLGACPSVRECHDEVDKLVRRQGRGQGAARLLRTVADRLRRGGRDRRERAKA